MQGYLTSHEVARLLQVSPSAILNWIDNDIIPAYRTPGGHRRVLKKDLVAFLKAQGMPVPTALAGVGRLLIVDDDTGFLKSTKRSLKRHAPDMDVDTAAGSVEALLKIGATRPDAILVDAMMPGIDGVELCKTLRSMPELADITVLAVSGKATRQLEKKFTSAGAIALLEKPLDFDELLDRLGHISAVTMASRR